VGFTHPDNLQCAHTKLTGEILRIIFQCAGLKLCSYTPNIQHGE